MQKCAHQRASGAYADTLIGALRGAGPIARVGHFDVGKDGAEVSAEALFDAWPIAPLIVAPFAPCVVQIIHADAAAWGDVAAVTDKGADWRG